MIPTGVQVPFDHELVIARPGPRMGEPFIVASTPGAGRVSPGRAGGGCRPARYANPLDGLYAR